MAENETGRGGRNRINVYTLGPLVLPSGCQDLYIAQKATMDDSEKLRRLEKKERKKKDFF